MIRRMNASLTVKLFCITCVLLMLACLLTYAFVAVSLPASYQVSLIGNLEKETEQLVDALSQVSVEESGALLRTFQMETGTSITVFDASEQPVEIDGISEDWRTLYDGLVVGIMMSESESSSDVLEDRSTGETTVTASGTYIAADASENDAAVGYQVQFADSEEPYTLVVTDNTGMAGGMEEALLRILPWLAGAVLLVSLLGAFIFSRYVTRPIVRLSAISQRLSALDFSWDTEITRKDEIGILSQSLHTLSERLSIALNDLKGQVARERTLQQKRAALFSSISHELKTPLTIIQGQLEGMIAGIGVYKDRDVYLQKTLDTAVQMGALVQQILTIFRMEHDDFSPQMASLDLSALLEESLAAHEILLAQRNMAVTRHIEAPLAILADRRQILRMFSALLTNAAQYSPAGETLRVNATRSDGHISITLENTGARIPEEELPQLFDAFYRVEPSRNRALGGTGLGLHIAGTILDRHGAAYALENSPDGVRFWMRFPQTS